MARRNLKAERNRFARNVSTDPQGELQELRKFAHNFTGQGASFNYHLITEIADSLRIYLRACDTCQEMEPHVVEVHFEAMQDVLDKELSGDGGDDGREIMARLHDAVALPPS
ncbi:MAG: hypothetical protein GKS00_10430 [Alphaproteobacteria bacterium]|nr:hypothetical protein [Alphaproteobacteria bacterium]